MYVQWDKQCKNYMEVNYHDYLPDNEFTKKYFWSQLYGLLGANWWSKVRSYEIEKPNRRFDKLVVPEMLLWSEDHMDDIRRTIDVYNWHLDQFAKTPEERKQMDENFHSTYGQISNNNEFITYEDFLVKRFKRFYDETVDTALLTIHNDLLTRCFLDDLALYGLCKILHVSQDILRDVESRLNRYSSNEMTILEEAAQVLMGGNGLLLSNLNLVKDAFGIEAAISV